MDDINNKETPKKENLKKEKMSDYVKALHLKKQALKLEKKVKDTQEKKSYKNYLSYVKELYKDKTKETTFYFHLELMKKGLNEDQISYLRNSLNLK